jgi:hypothetical protein
MTTWKITTPKKPITVASPSADKKIIEMIEAAAKRNGVKLERQ